MADVSFEVLDILPERFSTVPQLVARLRITESTGTPIHAMALRCQVRIEAQRRKYDDDEVPGLLDLFGSRMRWSSTLKPFLWLNASTMVQGFSESTETDLVIPCTYDFDVTASKYLHALREGAVPLALLFSGTIFEAGGTGFRVQQIPWDREAAYQMPVAVWRELMETHYPNAGWLRLDHETLRALAHYKAAKALPTWEAAIEALLARAEEEVR
ncbi:MAG TPA: DUF6084 family protein [Sinomonas sp.]|nr:DUF6084 family protein [Sinomonas sp.]